MGLDPLASNPLIPRSLVRQGVPAAGLRSPTNPGSCFIEQTDWGKGRIQQQVQQQVQL
ncbi:MAG: hypothetical protein MUF49_11785 [Oculatellaceae cyanobacterium Prado106]|nr:hypothetical protein [Oculatellaceae cyanobacterium Prado106]